MAEKLTVEKLREVKKELDEADRKLPRVYIDGEEYIELRRINYASRRTSTGRRNGDNQSP